MFPIETGLFEISIIFAFGKMEIVCYFDQMRRHYLELRNSHLSQNHVPFVFFEHELCILCAYFR